MSEQLKEKLWPLVPLLLALALTSLILTLAGASPLAAYAQLVRGAFGNLTSLAGVFTLMVPLMFCAAGLLITFTAGLWNIGVEGQIVMGAVAASWLARILQPDPELWGPLARWLASVPFLLVSLEMPFSSMPTHALLPARSPPTLCVDSSYRCSGIRTSIF